MKAHPSTVAVLPIDQLHPHEKNPRLSVRRDVVDGIKVGIQRDGFLARHAITVRPYEGAYQIVSGHHRRVAAIEVGLTELPCWVVELDDEAAYMALATDNAQGELSPLEVGMHALEAIGTEHKGGRGKKGGLRAYAELLGKSEATIRQNLHAAAVARNCEVDYAVLLDKAAHLSELHALPVDLWPEAVAHMLAKQWSVKDTAEAVKRSEVGGTLKRKLALFRGETTEREIKRIDELRQQVAAALDYDDIRAEWLRWLDETDPVDIKEVQHKRSEFENANAARLEAEEGKQRAALPEVVLADPPWRYDFAATDNRQIENQYPSDDLAGIIKREPKAADNCILFLWATAPKLIEAIELIRAWGFEYKTHAIWDKEKIGMGYWFRGQHELLLVGTRGDVKPPAEVARVSSIFREKRGEHSAKPACVYGWIERAYPNATLGEMYQRQKFSSRWINMLGNEAPRA